METFDPSRPDFAPYGFTCVRWTPTPMRRPDRHNEIELNFLETGWVTYLHGGNKIRIEAGQLSAFWAAIPHQIIDYGDEPEYFVVTLPLAWFLQSRMPDTFRHALLHGRVIIEKTTARTRSDAQMFSDWESDLRGRDATLKQAVLLEIQARLLRLAMAANYPRVVPTSKRGQRLVLSGGGLNKVERMAGIIAERYTERLTVEEIGKVVGLHPNYAMSLFQKTFGTTLIDYLTQHRISNAQRLLVTSDQKIVQVALDSGFGSISRFNDAFRRECGCSPREYRQKHRAG
ncbi:MAG: helix-turn-helix domain-containing protein [Akkermansiaceae bacterium]|nr:helix-turn-helix domain-containing protein [Verrucomicrobiales bacterium]